MFSSLSQSEDTNLIPPTRKEYGQITDESHPRLPVDCIGVIMSYNECLEVFKNIICLSKDVRDYVESGRNPFVCSHVKFKFSLVPKSGNEPLMYVRKLEVPKSKSLIFNSSVLNQFPNCVSLVLERVRSDWKLLENAPNLIKLSILNCTNMARGKTCFHGCSNNLESLEIDFSHLVGKRYFYSETLVSLPSLRKLILCQVTLKNFTREHFKNMKKLTVLRMKNVEFGNTGSVDGSSIFKFTPSLEVLELEEVKELKCDGFSLLNMEKLDEVSILNCSGLTKEGILKAFGKKPKKFEYDKHLLIRITRDVYERRRLAGMIGSDTDTTSEGWSDEEEDWT